MLSRAAVSHADMNRSSFSSTVASLVIRLFSIISTVPSCSATAWYVHFKFSPVSWITRLSSKSRITWYLAMSGLYSIGLTLLISHANFMMFILDGLTNRSSLRTLSFPVNILMPHILLWSSRSCRSSALYAFRYLTLWHIPLQ